MQVAALVVYLTSRRQTSSVIVFFDRIQVDDADAVISAALPETVGGPFFSETYG